MTFIHSFYCSNINALDATMKQCIPINKSQNRYCITGCNGYVSHFYDRSRIEFKWWVSNNRPTSWAYLSRYEVCTSSI